MSIDVLDILSPHRPFRFGPRPPAAHLTYSPADVMRRLMIDLGYVTSPALSQDWPAYVGQEPDDRATGVPDEVVTFYDTQGRDFGGDAFGTRLEHRGVQIRVRAPDHQTGYAKARQLAEVIDGEVLANTVAIGADVTYCVGSADRTSDVVALGKEPVSKRSIFTVNAVVNLKLTS